MSELPQRALILAGGLGTRLRSVVSDRPKVLAPVGDDETFCDVQIDFLVAQGFRRLVFLLGYKSEMVVEHIERRRARRWPAIEIAFSVEDRPLGTGGALKLAERFCERPFFLLNGDTYFEFSARRLIERHARGDASCTIAACQVDDASRYGTVELTADGRVIAFHEKRAGTGAGLINGGVYLMEPRLLDALAADRPVSLERELFVELVTRGELAADVQHGTFIDIGTPESYSEFTTRARRNALEES